MKCVSCKYYEPISEKHGNCQKIFEEYESWGEDVIETPDDVIVFGDGGHYDSVVVGKNFGCIHFENKVHQ